MDFAASCKKKKDDKTCSINFCHKCLLNRYDVLVYLIELLVMSEKALEKLMYMLV